MIYAGHLPYFRFGSFFFNNLSSKDILLAFEYILVLFVDRKLETLRVVGIILLDEWLRIKDMSPHAWNVLVQVRSFKSKSADGEEAVTFIF